MGLGKSILLLIELTFLFNPSTLPIMSSIDFHASSVLNEPEDEREVKSFAMLCTELNSRSICFWDVRNIFR